MADLRGARIDVKGVVQGVGFRPFVYGLAKRYGLTGWVRNTSAGVEIEVDGADAALAAFMEALEREAPPLARIDSVEAAQIAANGFTRFAIEASLALEGAFQPIAPDVAVCAECLRELFDPADRRFRYPFINCTNCGPRFTIIRDVPYDRPQTTMSPFPMCDACAAEYHDPLDRRFHAQPVACPACGPQVWLQAGRGMSAKGFPHREKEAAIRHARRLLAGGRIVAVKGLGGFHLACDGTNEAAVRTLRERKQRVEKPLALMMADVAAVRRDCYVDETEEQLLTSAARPIVIVGRRPASTIAPGVAPGQDTLGVMLPYTPLHYLLLAAATDGEGPVARALVMTSGNVSEEPIAYGNDEALERLGPLADAFLLHDREIYARCDDSVVRPLPRREKEAGDGHRHARYRGAAPYLLRRSRGYAPNPLRLPWTAPPVLAAGAELKNAFCLTRERFAFLSQHVGDLENYETLRAFEEGVRHFERLFGVRPEAVAYDLHPDYLATRYALARAEKEGLPAVGVQHHHAHVAACMADNGLSGERPVIGVSFDGTGYGHDGAIWGGEFLVADYDGYERAAHLAYVPLAGGERAVKEPWRLALAWLRQCGRSWAEALPPTRHARRVSHEKGEDALGILEQQLATGLNAPPTSSMGRLFAAVAALAGVRQTVNYEAQAAVELEALARAREQEGGESGAYPFTLEIGVVDPRPLMAAVADDVRAGVDQGVISARFHNSVAQMVVDVCRGLQRAFDVSDVALSGGVWQNAILLQQTMALLQANEFTVYVHRQAPANDGGLALGQAVIAARRLQEPHGREGKA